MEIDGYSRFFIALISSHSSPPVYWIQERFLYNFSHGNRDSFFIKNDYIYFLNFLLVVELGNENLLSLKNSFFFPGKHSLICKNLTRKMSANQKPRIVLSFALRAGRISMMGMCISFLYCIVLSNEKREIIYLVKYGAYSIISQI